MQISRTKTLSPNQRLTKILLAAGLILVMAALFIVPLDNFQSCAFHSLTGYSCLTCGMTRSLHAILHGDLVGSLRFHLFGPILFLCVLLFSIVLWLEIVSGRGLKLKTTRGHLKHFTVLFLVFWLVYWAGRILTELIA
ncbi:MAG: DUF2752 domain-containing protein [bacterium]